MPFLSVHRGFSTLMSLLCTHGGICHPRRHVLEMSIVDDWRKPHVLPDGRNGKFTGVAAVAEMRLFTGRRLCVQGYDGRHAGRGHGTGGFAARHGGVGCHRAEPDRPELFEQVAGLVGEVSQKQVQRPADPNSRASARAQGCSQNTQKALMCANEAIPPTSCPRRGTPALAELAAGWLPAWSDPEAYAAAGPRAADPRSRASPPARAGSGRNELIRAH